MRDVESGVNIVEAEGDLAADIQSIAGQALIALCGMQLRQDLVDLRGGQQIVIPNPVVLLQISPVSLSPNSDFNFFFGRYFQIGKLIIALPGICAACFFINAFHRQNLLCFMLFSFYRRFSGKTNVSITVLTIYTEKEYEPFDSYSHFCPAMPVSVCFSDTALYTLSKRQPVFFFLAI